MGNPISKLWFWSDEFKTESVLTAWPAGFEMNRFALSALHKDGSEEADNLSITLRDRGYAIISLDEPNGDENSELSQAIDSFYDAGHSFFSQPMNLKLRCEHPNEILGRDNRGYVSGSNKEFLKFRSQDPITIWPQEVPELKSSHEELFPALFDVAWTVFSCLAQFQIEEVDRSQTSVRRLLFSERDVAAVRDIAPEMTSLGLNHYYSVSSNSSVHYPSSVHEDTGLLTLVVCSDVPGLQIKDRALDQWVDVERLARPKRDAIVFMGEKIPLFSASNQFPATTHRVALPEDKERTSLIFFFDVSK